MGTLYHRFSECQLDSVFFLLCLESLLPLATHGNSKVTVTLDLSLTLTVSASIVRHAIVPVDEGKGSDEFVVGDLIFHASIILDPEPIASVGAKKLSVVTPLGVST
jgi:hypothetical protein